MPEKISNNASYASRTSSQTAWCFAIALIAKSHLEANASVALAERTFEDGKYMAFNLVKEAASLIADYRVYCYEHDSSIVTLPIFIYSTACKSPLGIEVEFNPHLESFLQRMKSAILNLNEDKLLTPHDLLNHINTLEWPIDQSSFKLQMDVKMYDDFGTDLASYTFSTRPQLDAE